MPVIQEILGEEEAPRSKYFLYTLFLSTFFTLMFTTSNFSFRRGGADLSIKKHDKDKRL